MSHSFVSALFHVVFSTKHRKPTIREEFRARLWKYMGGIARKHKMKALAIGGTADHCHLLISLPSTMDIAKAVQLIKGGSSKWVHDEIPDSQQFAWQEGYGAFSIGVSQKPATIKYIRNQEEHHRKKTFKEEFEEFLVRHEMEFDVKFIWN